MNKNHSNNKFQQEPQPSFRNTKSKFYKKKTFDFDQKQQFNKNQTFLQDANYWKEEGNNEFKMKNYFKAIQCYSKAIQINPSQSIYFCNRAKCYKQLKQYQKALRDAQQCCQLDSQNIKANYICGCILAQLGKIDHLKLLKSQNRFKKALRLCTKLKKTQFQQEISIKYYRLKKLLWYINQQKQIQILTLTKNNINNKNNDKQQQKKIKQNLQKRINQLKQYVKKKQIPDFLCCKITLQLMQDPVTTQQGLTYQRSALEDHFNTNGMIEPISRKKLNNMPVPNYAIKSAVLRFLQENPWAYQQGNQNDYFSIQF